jgi:nucleoside-diphosphate-sugar epimerase
LFEHELFGIMLQAKSMSTLLCLGLGYCAEHYVAQHGTRFARVVGTTRTAERAAALSARDRNVDMQELDGAAVPDALRATAGEASALLISAAPDERGDPVLRALGDALAASARLRTVVLLSTVGVYGDRGGGWVDETAALEPVHERSRPRVVAEQAWQALGRRRGVTVAILRLSGIYGPGRNALVNVRLGRARNIDKPGQVFNRIHVADIAQAIDATFAQEADGVFNVTDDAPSPPGDPIVLAADLLGMPPPPVIPYAEAAKTMTPLAASFYAENRRVRNDRLKQMLGVRLRYPTYREGLRALHAQGEGKS